MSSQDTMDVEIPEEMEETVTGDDVKDIDNDGPVPVGKYHCTLVDIRGKQLTALACLGLNFKLRVNHAIEIEGKKVDRAKGEEFSERIIWDDIPLPAAGQKDFHRKRRLRVARVFDLLQDGGATITKAMWFSLIGHDIGVETSKARQKNDKTGKWEDIDYIKVDPFKGYFRLDGAATSQAAAEPEISADDI